VSRNPFADAYLAGVQVATYQALADLRARRDELDRLRAEHEEFKELVRRQRFAGAIEGEFTIVDDVKALEHKA